MAQAVCKERGVDHRIVHLPFINELFSSTLLQSGGEIPDGMYNEPDMKVTVVPFRNGIMLAIAAGYAESIGASEVLLATHAGDHFIYPDCRPEFNTTFGQAVLLGTDNKVSIRFPFATIDKRAVGDLGRRLGVDFSRTWTCYKGHERHCGTCGACQERKYALRHDEGQDVTDYER
jgi:7-cyano-7-deazaguanine synthase